MTTRSAGFSLVELIVVCAILGVLAAVGTVAYNGYVAGTKKTSAKNTMQTISLAQTEELSNTGMYFTQDTDCSPTSDTSQEIEDTILGGADQISVEMGYHMCIQPAGSGYEIKARLGGVEGRCEMVLSQTGAWREENC